MNNRRSIALVAGQILKKAGHPLHYTEITKRLLPQFRLVGMTPHQTVRSRLATDARFKRVAEGVYALAEWREYPATRFAKDIAYDVLKSEQKPVTLSELGGAILRVRNLVGGPNLVARNGVRSDNRF